MPCRLGRGYSVRQSMDHDVAARRQAERLGGGEVVGARIGNMQGEMEAAVGIAAIDIVATFRRPAVALPPLVSHRVAAQVDAVGAHRRSALDELERAYRKSTRLNSRH